MAKIRQYLNGELDAREMYQLERRAQHDPFLMDALEGYSNHKGNTHNLQADLGQRLQRRIAGEGAVKVYTMLSWRKWAAAAAVLTVCGAGLWWHAVQPGQPQQVAMVPSAMGTPHIGTVPAVAGKSGVSAAVAPPKPAPAARQQVAVVVQKEKNAPSEPTVAQPEQEPPQDILKKLPTLAAAPVQQDTLMADSSVRAYAAKQKVQVLGAGKSVPTIKTGSQRLLSQQLQGKVEGARVDPAPGDHHLDGLLGSTDVQPLAGTLVKIKDMTRNGAITSRDGNVSLQAQDKDVLVSSSNGYQSREVKAGRRDSGQVSLQPAQPSVSEIIVMDYKASNKAAGAKAEPLMGWKAYGGYLAHIPSPDGRTGQVKLTFTVDPNGNLNNFKVTESLGNINDQEAINLIKKGPAWHGSTSGKNEQVSVKVNFERP